MSLLPNFCPSQAKNVKERANLTFRGPCIVIYAYNKTNEMHYFSNLFWNRTLRVLDRFTVHHQESSTVYTAIGICHTGDADCLPAGSGWILIPLAGSWHNLYDKYLFLCVFTVQDSWWWTVNPSETCKVLFQNKFEKFVHLVGFIVRKERASMFFLYPNKYSFHYTSFSKTHNCLMTLCTSPMQVEI
jgi:hypothetical protein